MRDTRGAAGVEPKLAVSVLMLHGEAPDLEIFIQNRTATMDFAPGAVVFPGGRVDPADYRTAAALPPAADVLERHARAWQDCAIANTPARPDGLTEARTQMPAVLLAAAEREVREETGATLAVDELIPWANWVTPPGGPKRFDTYFYLTVAAPSVEPRHQTTEADSSHWAPVQKLLRDAAEGRIRLLRPTQHLLLELANLDPTSAAMAEERRITPANQEKTADPSH